jgi:hypothetical protein
MVIITVVAAIAESATVTQKFASFYCSVAERHES